MYICTSTSQIPRVACASITAPRSTCKSALIRRPLQSPPENIFAALDHGYNLQPATTYIQFLNVTQLYAPCESKFDAVATTRRANIDQRSVCTPVALSVSFLLFHFFFPHFLTSHVLCLLFLFFFSFFFAAFSFFLSYCLKRRSTTTVSGQEILWGPSASSTGSVRRRLSTSVIEHGPANSKGNGPPAHTISSLSQKWWPFSFTFHLKIYIQFSLVRISFATNSCVKIDGSKSYLLAVHTRRRSEYSSY